MSKKSLEYQLKTLWNYFKKPNYWYTGLVLKSYLEKNIFNPKSNLSDGPAKTFKPTKITRWSVYAHQNQITAFQNILENLHSLQNLQTYKPKILVHPLIKASLLRVLQDQGFETWSLDIDRFTLNWSPKKLSDFLKLNKPDQVIFYTFNGLTEEISQSLEELKTLSIPSIIILDNDYLNTQTFQLFWKHDFGAVLWNSGESWLQNQLINLLPFEKKPSDCYLSWVSSRKNKITDNLEYHLSESRVNFQKIIYNYFYLLLEEYKKYNKLAFLYQFLSRFLLEDAYYKKLDSQKAREFFRQEYDQLISKSAISDLIFDLAALDDKELDLFQQTIKQRPLIHNQLQETQNFIQVESNNHPSQQLEVVKFFSQREYLNYFFYAQDPRFWFDSLSNKGFIVSKKLEADIRFAQKLQLKQTEFVLKHLVQIDLTYFF